MAPPAPATQHVREFDIKHLMDDRNLRGRRNSVAATPTSRHDCPCPDGDEHPYELAPQTDQGIYGNERWSLGGENCPRPDGDEKHHEPDFFLLWIKD